jgi:hypothetical protein
MSDHAPLAPSFAPVWGECSGAVPASEGVPNLDSQESRNGTAAHWVASECLSNYTSTESGLPLTTDWWLDKQDPDGTVIDQKLIEGAAVMVGDVTRVAQEHGALRSMLVEHRVHAPQVHPDNWGTLDCAIPLLTLPRPKIYIWDYKHGHRENRAEGNLQLINYAAGLVNELNLNGADDQLVDVHIRIVQPFCYSAPNDVDEWVVKLADLRGYFNQLHQKAHESRTGPTLTSGKHCRDCPAVGKCSASRKGRYAYIEYVNEPYEMDTMNAAELAVERGILRDGLAAAKARLEAVEDDLTHRLQAGASGSGLTLESKPGRLAWDVPVAQAIALAGQFGIDNSVAGVLTPTQTTGKIPAAMKPAFKQVLESVASRPAGSLKLINADDSPSARAFTRRK